LTYGSFEILSDGFGYLEHETNAAAWFIKQSAPLREGVKLDPSSARRPRETPPATATDGGGCLFERGMAPPFPAARSVESERIDETIQRRSRITLGSRRPTEELGSRLMSSDRPRGRLK